MRPASLRAEVYAFLKTKDGTISLSHVDIATALGCNATGVRSAIRTLEREGSIRVWRGTPPNPSTYRIIAERPETLPRWSPERAAWVETNYPHQWAAPLVAALNAMPGPRVTANHIKDRAKKRKWHKTPELLATRATPVARPVPIVARPVPPPIVKQPAARNVWAARQTVFAPLMALKPRCLFSGCPGVPVGRWCVTHSEMMGRPAGELRAALEGSV